MDDSALAAMGLLQGALDLARHAHAAVSRSSDPDIRNQRVSVELIEAQVLAILSGIGKKRTKNSHALMEPANKAMVEPAPTEVMEVDSPLDRDALNRPENIPEISGELRDGARIQTNQSVRNTFKLGAKNRERVIRAQEAFRAVDIDESGALEEDELRRALVKLGIEKSRVEDVVVHMMDTLDSSGDGEIDQSSFVDFLTRDDYEDGELAKAVRDGFNSISDHLVDKFNLLSEAMVIGNSETLINPRSRLSVNWDIGVGVLLIITIFTMPLSMAFEDAQRDLRGLDVLADAIFIMDICKHFNTGYIDDFDYTVMDRKKVRQNYLYSWFLPDAMSSIPLELIDLVFQGFVPSNLRATKALKLLRLSRLAKIVRILKLPKLSKLFRDMQDKVEDHFQIKFDDASLAMASLFLGLMVLAHWVGCCSFMIAREFNFPSDSWVVNANIVDEPIGTQYSWCMFRALMSMIGSGFEDPPIVNTVCTERTTWCTIEHWITLVCLYIGSVFYALLIAAVADVMSKMNKGGSKLAEMMWGLNEYLRYKKVPMDIKNRVRSFFRLEYSEGKVYDEDEVLACLPPNLREDILSYNNRALYRKVPMLHGDTSKSFLAKLAPMLSSRFVFKGEVIIEEDSTGAEMFFITSGIVEVSSKHCDFVVKALADGCYFGEVALLFNCKRTATISARINTSLSAVSKIGLLDALNDHPKMHRRMFDAAKKRQARMYVLDESKVEMCLSSEDLEDSEDDATKFFGGEILSPRVGYSFDEKSRKARSLRSDTRSVTRPMESLDSNVEDYSSHNEEVAVKSLGQKSGAASEVAATTPRNPPLDTKPAAKALEKLDDEVTTAVSKGSRLGNRGFGLRLSSEFPRSKRVAPSFKSQEHKEAWATGERRKPS